MKDNRPTGKKMDGSTSYGWNVPDKRGWSFEEQRKAIREREMIRFRGKPQSKHK